MGTLDDANDCILKEDFEAFRQSCVLLRSAWIHHKALEEASIDVAPIFFGDVRWILREYLVGAVCKLSEPEKSFGNKWNLSLEFLIKRCDVGTADKAKLEETYARICSFRQKLLPARNKIISHLDLQAVHERKPLGGVSNDKWLEFWLDLQDILAILSQCYAGETGFYLNGVSPGSDIGRRLRSRC
jgi:AbiU2